MFNKTGCGYAFFYLNILVTCMLKGVISNDPEVGLLLPVYYLVDRRYCFKFWSYCFTCVLYIFLSGIFGMPVVDRQHVFCYLLNNYQTSQVLSSFMICSKTVIKAVEF